MNMELSTGPTPVGKPDTVAEGVSGFPARCLRFGAFQLDVQRQELHKDGAQIKVQGKVYQALVTLLENPGEIVTREVLRARMWPRDTGLNYDANVNTTVNKLRRLLGDTGEQVKFIETIPRRGYSFIAQVEYSAEPEMVRVRDGKTAGYGEIAGVPNNFLASIFRSNHASVWFTAGVVALTIAAMLFGAAITLYSHHRPF
jgi:DNA-binding winged helix-turn-helix (wHTH) protein